jgi:hypothetical protein
MTKKKTPSDDENILLMKSDSEIAKDIRHALDSFNSDEKFKHALKVLFARGFSLGLFTRGEQNASTVKESNTSEVTEGSNNEAIAGGSSSKRPKKNPNSVAEVTAKKNKAILSAFGHGGLRVDKLIRCLNNTLISNTKTISEHMNLTWEHSWITTPQDC